MQSHFIAGTELSFRQMSDGSISGYIEYVLDDTQGVIVRTVDMELQPVPHIPGSKEWMMAVFEQVVDYH